MRLWRWWLLVVRISWAWRTADRGEVAFREFNLADGALPKLGQILANQRHIFGDLFCDAMTRLQFEAPSVGHVVRDGDDAVKSIKANVRKLVEQDLRILWWLAVVPVLKFGDARRELKRQYAKEFCLPTQAAHYREMADVLAPHGIKVPKVTGVSATELRTEWIDGITIAQLLLMPIPERCLWLLRHGFASQKDIAKRTMVAKLRTVLSNRYQLDDHAGNLMLSKRATIWMIDVTCGSSDAAFMETFTLFIRALTLRAYQEAAREFCLMCRNLVWHGIWALSGLANARMVRLKRRLARVMADWCDLVDAGVVPFAQRSFTALANLMVGEVVKSWGSMEWSWAPLHRTMCVFESVPAGLWPSMDYLKVARRTLADADARMGLTFHPMRALNAVGETAIGAARGVRLSNAEGLQTALERGW